MHFTRNSLTFSSTPNSQPVEKAEIATWPFYGSIVLFPSTKLPASATICPKLPAASTGSSVWCGAFFKTAKPCVSLRLTLTSQTPELSGSLSVPYHCSKPELLLGMATQKLLTITFWSLSVLWILIFRATNMVFHNILLQFARHGTRRTMMIFTTNKNLHRKDRNGHVIETDSRKVGRLA